VSLLDRIQQALTDPTATHALWEELAEDPFHRCALAHHAADRQTDPQAALAWDLRALAAADAVGDDRVAGFYPSLHLNLAEAYRQVGDLAAARDHLGRAQAVLDRLPDDGYGRLVRAGVARLAGRLDG